MISIKDKSNSESTELQVFIKPNSRRSGSSHCSCSGGFYYILDFAALLQQLKLQQRLAISIALA